MVFGILMVMAAIPLLLLFGTLALVAPPAPDAALFWEFAAWLFGILFLLGAIQFVRNWLAERRPRRS